jgi:heavy metal efflux system protein
MLKSILAFALSRRPIILLGLLVFIGGGVIAFKKLNIEAYPNPAPVILEITAQAAGLSAEEMERYYTVPLEVGLYQAPGVVNVRSTSFYGLSFVRVTFEWGVDYYTAYTRAALSLQQNVSLPNGVSPTIQRLQPGRRSLSLPNSRSAELRADQPTYRTRLDRYPPPVHCSRGRCSELVGRHYQAV